MEIQGIHPSSEDVALTSFLRSVMQKIVWTENNQPMTVPNDARLSEYKIDRVPDGLRDQNENVYCPTTVSIGPLHRGTERLQAMEPVKLSYMCSLLKRAGTFEDRMRHCAARMLELEEVVWRSYKADRLQTNTENNNWLAEVMLIDGCFIIELLFRNFEDQYDPILWNPFKLYAIQRDLLLLENQIPWFVLCQLFQDTVDRIPQDDRNSVHELQSPDNRNSLVLWIGFFFGDMLGGLESVQRLKMENIYSRPSSFHGPINGEPFHILHYFHVSYLPGDRGYAFNARYEERTKFNYSATQLRLAGVELKPNKFTNLFDVRFSTAFSCCSCSSLFRKGYLEIPPLPITESTEFFFKNLIAFEISCPEIDSHFTSLAFLMDLLIDTPEDVQLFEEAGIIHNYLGLREEVARLFNGICKNAIPRRFLYGKQYKEAINFCNPWRVSTGRLKHYYFGNPWSGISVIAAIILFTLAFLQTLYSLLSYYK